jgi:hypothetical protein
VPDDPYAEFLREQQSREESWKTNRATKKARIESDTEKLTELKEQLETKSKECRDLRRTVQALNERSQCRESNTVPENVCKVSHFNSEFHGWYVTMVVLLVKVFSITHKRIRV